MSTTESNTEFEPLLQWLRDSGAEVEGLCIGPSDVGGVGVFAMRKFLPGELIASIPRQCVLTPQDAQTRSRALQDGAPPAPEPLLQ